MRIGIFGGTFDPPHVGHLALGRAAIDQLGLDELVFVPASRNPLKPNKAESSAKHRLAMVDELISRQPQMAFSDCEVKRGGPSYAVDTLSDMQAARPADYWFVMGADSLRTLPAWKNVPRLLKLCRLAVAVRPPLIVADVLVKLPTDVRAQVDIVKMPALEISSTALKSRIRLGQDPGSWITPEVLKYVRAHNLYRDT